MTATVKYRRRPVKVELTFPDGTRAVSTNVSTWRQNVRHLRDLARELQRRGELAERAERGQR